MKKSPFKINPKFILNISVRLAVFFVILSFLSSFFRLYKENRAEERMDSEHVYFDLQQESSPFSSSVEEYTELYAQLCSSSLYDYYECYPQYLEGLPVSQSFLIMKRKLYPKTVRLLYAFRSARICNTAAILHVMPEDF